MGSTGSRRRWLWLSVSLLCCALFGGYLLAVERHLRLESADHELDAIVDDPGFATTPSGAREVRLERSSHCGNPGFDDYPPGVVRTVEVPSSVRAAARSELRRALRDAGWKRSPARHASPNDWHRDFGEFTASLSIYTRADDYADVPDGRAWLELVASVREPDYCDPW